MTDKDLLLLPALAPTAMSLIGIIFAKSDLKDVQRTQESLSKKMDDMAAAGHRYALEIMRQMTALHEGVAVVETKQGR